MAVRNTRTGGARKRVTGEKRKGTTTTSTTTNRPKPASKETHVQGSTKKAPMKSTSTTGSQATSRRPNMNDQYKPAPKAVTPKEKPAPKTTVKVDPTKKQRPNQMDEVSGNQFKKKTSTGSK